MYYCVNKQSQMCWLYKKKISYSLPYLPPPRTPHKPIRTFVVPISIIKKNIILFVPVKKKKKVNL